MLKISSSNAIQTLDTGSTGKIAPNDLRKEQADNLKQTKLLQEIFNEVDPQFKGISNGQEPKNIYGKNQVLHAGVTRVNHDHDFGKDFGRVTETDLILHLKMGSGDEISRYKINKITNSKVTNFTIFKEVNNKYEEIQLTEKEQQKILSLTKKESLYNLPSEYFEKIKNTVLISDEKTINPDVVKVKTFSERSPETKAPEIIFFYNVEKNELSFRISGHEISYVFSGKVDLKSGRVNDAEWTDVVWNGRSTPDKLSSSEASYHLESFLKKWGSKEK